MKTRTTRAGGIRELKLDRLLRMTLKVTATMISLSNSKISSFCTIFTSKDLLV